MPSVPWRVEFSKIFQFFFSKFQKCPKSFPKVSKRVLNVFWANFSKIFCPVFHGVSNLRKFSKKSKKISKFQKRPKSFPKESKRVLIVIWTIFSKNFCAVSHGRSSLRKFSKKIFSKFQKGPKVFSKVSKRVLNMFWGKIFEKIYAQCSMEGRVFENFPKNQKKISKFKNAQKCSQNYPNVF